MRKVKAPRLYVIHKPTNSVLYDDMSIFRVERYISRMAQDCRESVANYEVAIGEGDLAWRMMTNEAAR